MTKSQKGNIVLIVLPMLLVIGVAVGGYLYLQNQNKVENQPLTWEECIKVPGAILQTSYPGRCVTPDGRSVVQPISDEDKKNLQPPPDLNCQQDNECLLVVNESWVNCPVPRDVCAAADYSESKWVPVNQNWYSLQTKNCTGFECPSLKPVNDGFAVKCINKSCQKMRLDQKENCCSIEQTRQGKSCYKTDGPGPGFSDRCFSPEEYEDFKKLPPMQ